MWAPALQAGCSGPSPASHGTNHDPGTGIGEQEGLTLLAPQDLSPQDLRVAADSPQSGDEPGWCCRQEGRRRRATGTAVTKPIATEGAGPRPHRHSADGPPRFTAVHLVVPSLKKKCVSLQDVPPE